jgi:phage terminase large subunit-like protein
MLSVSSAELLASLPEQEREQALQKISTRTKAQLAYLWSFWARPSQIAPPGDWVTWLILAGRGFGKTRTGSEWVRSIVCGSTPLAAGTHSRIALVAETAADARDVLVEGGSSGLLAVHPKEFRPAYEPSKRRLTWPNGAQATLYNGTEPDQLRGPQHDAALVDELAKYREAQETWDMLQFGLRLGLRPRQCITTTPRPIPLLKQLIGSETTVVTRGSTFENRSNLAPSFLDQVVKRYQGTRLGRQELNAEILDDVPGALWTRAMFDSARIDKAPDLRRIVVAVDPSGTSGDDDGDSIGIVVAGVGIDGRGYVLADRTCSLSPAGWSRRVVEAYQEFSADRVVAERNFGGAMVEAVVRTAAKEARLSVAYKDVVASRGKTQRAEPVAALFEQRRVKLVGSFPELEDQLCVAKGTLIETGRGQIPIEGVTLQDCVMTRNGLAPIRWVGYTGVADRLVEIETLNSTLRVTECHPIFLPKSQEFVAAKHVQPSDLLLESHRWGGMGRLLHGGADGIIGCQTDISVMQRASYYIARRLRRTPVRYRPASMFTTLMRIAATIIQPTWWRSQLLSTLLSMNRGALLLSSIHLSGDAPFAERRHKQSTTATNDTVRTVARSEPSGPRSPSRNLGSISAGIAGKVELLPHRARSSSVTSNARMVTASRVIEMPGTPVYNLSAADGYLPEYYANGVLTHNCAMTSDGYVGEGSPDRADAMVWALSELMVVQSAPVARIGTYSVR